MWSLNITELAEDHNSNDYVLRGQGRWQNNWVSRQATRGPETKQHCRLRTWRHVCVWGPCMHSRCCCVFDSFHTKMDNGPNMISGGGGVQERKTRPVPSSPWDTHGSSYVYPVVNHNFIDWEQPCRPTWRSPENTDLYFLDGTLFLLLWACKDIVFIVVAHCDQDYRCSLGSILATSCDLCVLRWTIPPTERPTRIMDKSNLAWSNKQSECSPLPEWTDNTSQVEPVHVRHLDRARGTTMMIHRAKCD